MNKMIPEPENRPGTNNQHPFGIIWQGLELPSGSLSYDDAWVLLKYTTGVDLALDLGTHNGRSAVIMSLQAKRVVTIDNYAASLPLNYSEKRTRKNLSVYPNINRVIGDSGVAIPIGQIDVLFIDTSHTEKVTTGVFNAWFDQVKLMGIVIFHDYTIRYRGVVTAVRNIFETCEDIEFVEYTGCCFVARKNSSD